MLNYQRVLKLRGLEFCNKNMDFKKKAWQVHVENTVADSHRMKNFLMGT